MQNINAKYYKLAHEITYKFDGKVSKSPREKC